MKVDVAVIGAGPAGTIAAARLAAQGVQVALLEQGKFPRDKSCGDGVTSDGLAALQRSGLGQWADSFPAMKNLRLSAPDGSILDMDLEAGVEGAVGRLIPRRLLDERLARQAAACGAKLLEEVKAGAIEIAGEEMARIKTQRSEIEAQIVILAEGSHAALAKRLGLAKNGPELLAARQYFAGDSGPSDRLEIHFQNSIIPGYNWLFPMGDGHANVGTGTYTHNVENRRVDLKAELQRFKEDPILEGRLMQSEPAGAFRGAPLRSQFGTVRTYARRLLVAGDAAGLVNPFTGVGIGQAMISGEIAAAHALAALRRGNFSPAALSSYSRALTAQYAADLRAARFIRAVLSNRALLNWAFKRLQSLPDLARLLGQVFLAKRSPQELLQAKTIARFSGF